MSLPVRAHLVISRVCAKCKILDGRVQLQPSMQGRMAHVTNPNPNSRTYITPLTAAGALPGTCSYFSPLWLVNQKEKEQKRIKEEEEEEENHGDDDKGAKTTR